MAAEHVVLPHVVECVVQTVLLDELSFDGPKPSVFVAHARNPQGLEPISKSGNAAQKIRAMLSSLAEVLRHLNSLGDAKLLPKSNATGNQSLLI